MPFETQAARRDLDTLAAGIDNNARQALRTAVQEAERHAKATTLYTSHSADGLRSKTVGTVDGFDGKLVAATPYARFVENGTPPHRIEPKNATVLRFVMNGQVVFRRAVQHPGTAERPFMAQAAKHGEQVLEYGVDYFTDHAIEVFNRT